MPPAGTKKPGEIGGGKWGVGTLSVTALALWPPHLDDGLVVNLVFRDEHDAHPPPRTR